MKPVRIQRRRTKGWRMPKNTVFVGRPTRWGNPFMIHGEDPQARITAVRLFKNMILRSASLRRSIKKELAGKNLACWCSEAEICHADILLEIANESN